VPSALRENSFDLTTLVQLEAELARVIDALATNADGAQVPLSQI
jgi:hypothetical protein